MLRLTGFLAISLLALSGCSSEDAANSASRTTAGTPPDAQLQLPPIPQLRRKQIEEDPDLKRYYDAKGWRLIYEPRPSDKKWLIHLCVQAPGKSPEQRELSEHDYSMIAASKTVQVLELNDVTCTDAGIAEVATLTRLESILLGGDKITDGGLKALTRCPSLTEISLQNSPLVTDAGIKELARLPRLESLTLCEVPVSGQAMEAFRHSTTLTSLSLDSDVLTEQAIQFLVQVASLQKLTVLRKSGTSKTLTKSQIQELNPNRLSNLME